MRPVSLRPSPLTRADESNLPPGRKGRSHGSGEEEAEKGRKGHEAAQRS